MSKQTWLIRYGWRSLGLLTALLSAASITFAQENWPQFRGAEARGVGASDRLPLVWGLGTNIA